MERWNGRVALVTGASAGIGAAIVRALVNDGMKVVGCARRMDRMQELASELIGSSGKFFPMKCDLGNEDEILAMFDAIRSHPELGGVDVCVNNAGLGKNAPILSGKTEDWRKMLEINVLALSICSRESVKSMNERDIDDGHVFLISSIAGHRIVRRSSSHFYTATKFAVKALTEGIRNELREMKSHIRVTAISPGLTDTEFAYQTHSDNPEIAEELYNTIECLKADDVASNLTHALQSPPHVQIHDILLRPTEYIP